MMQNLIHMVYLAGAFLALFAIGELLYHKAGINSNMTRKIVHIGTGLLTMFFPILLSDHWFVLLLCGSFFIILLVSVPLNLLPSINKVDRVTRGSLLYPIIVYGCFLVQKEQDSLVYYYIPILILALCDPLAELVGRRLPWIRYKTFGHTKTISGSLGFFAGALIVTTVLLKQIEHVELLSALMIGILISVATTIAEAFSHKGYDNLTIPASALTVLFLLMNMEYLSC